MTAILAFCSLGTDFGRVQVAKTELRRAVDAAARAAALACYQGKTTAQARADAIATAAQNTVDGQPLVLTAADVVVGKWTGSAFEPGSTPSNAVSISVRLTDASGKAVPLIFARVIGQNACEISAGTVALFAPGNGPPIVGVDGISVGSSSTFASYDSNVGVPGGANVSDNADLGSNGTVTLGGTSAVRGDINLGPSGSTSVGSGFFTTGTTNRLSTALTYPATETPPVASWGDWIVATGSTVYLPAGTYSYDDVVFAANCTVVALGPVTVYLTGNFSAGDNLTVVSYQNRPGNFKLRLVGTGKSYTVGANYNFTGAIYGPGFNFTAGNGLQINGSIVAKQIVGGSGTSVNYDTRLPPPSLSPGQVPVSTVR
jgi:hypothetical protein